MTAAREDTATHTAGDDAAESARDQLAQRLVDSAVPAMELFAVHLGLELGLYRALDDASTNPSDGQSTGGLTEAELAARAGIAPRYAREWLEHQVVSGFITCDDPTSPAADRIYRLPPGHAEVMLDADSPYHTGPVATMLAGIARALPLLPDAFRTAVASPTARTATNSAKLTSRSAEPSRGSSTTSRPPGWRRVYAGRGRKTRPRSAGARTRPRLWRRHINTRARGGVPENPHCRRGPGRARSIAADQAEAARVGLSNRVTFVLADANQASGGGPFDFATIFETLHDMGDPVGVSRAVGHGLADDGTAAVADERVGDELHGDAGRCGADAVRFQRAALPAGDDGRGSSRGGWDGIARVNGPTWAAEAGSTSCTQLAVRRFWRFHRMDRSVVASGRRSRSNVDEAVSRGRGVGVTPLGSRTMDPPGQPNLALRDRRIDIFFAVVFAAFTVTSIISDLLPTVGVNFSHPSPNFFVQSNSLPNARREDRLRLNPRASLYVRLSRAASQENLSLQGMTDDLRAVCARDTALTTSRSTLTTA